MSIFSGKIGIAGPGELTPGRWRAIVEEITEANNIEIKLELLARAVGLILINSLNDELDIEDAKWVALDVELDALLGETASNYQSDHVQLSNFHIGRAASFIKSFNSDFPSVHIECREASGGGPINLDSGENFSLNLSVKAFIKSGPHSESSSAYGEKIANKKVQRITEAIHSTISKYKGLTDIVDIFDFAPVIHIEDCMKLADNNTIESFYYFQSVRIEYIFSRNTLLQ